MAAPKEKEAGTFDKRILTRLDFDKAMEHIVYLSETIGICVATSDEEKAAAEYIKNVFEEYEYENAEIQEFDYYSSEAELFVGNDEIDAYGATGKRFRGHDEVTADLVDCGLGLLETEFPAEVKNNIALIRRGY